MPAMTGNAAFRQGLALPEHRQLFDYWVSLHAGSSMPCRSDLRPAAIARLLPSVTLIDIEKPVAKSRIRLAGTRIVEHYHAEITGRTLDELGWGEHHGYWLAAIDEAAASCKPAAGVLSNPRSNLMHHWLRLPLRNRTDHVAIVLCHDIQVAVAGQNGHRKMVTF
jgi:hypothetical protein